jgi:hypothetical protein
MSALLSPERIAAIIERARGKISGRCKPWTQSLQRVEGDWIFVGQLDCSTRHRDLHYDVWYCPATDEGRLRKTVDVRLPSDREAGRYH